MQPTTAVRMRCRDDPGMPVEDALWEVLSRRFGGLATQTRDRSLLVAADVPRERAVELLNQALDLDAEA
jgi:hypothetical protein